MGSHGITHGHARLKKRTREYIAWWSMHQRCTNPKTIGWNNYGGRGITVCERWFKFENFYADVGKCTNGFSLDRKDNNGNYEPSNCKWASRIDQQSNKRTNRLLTLDGQTDTVTGWARRLGVPSGRLFCRLNYGWSAKRTLRESYHKQKAHFNDIRGIL